MKQYAYYVSYMDEGDGGIKTEWFHTDRKINKFDDVMYLRDEVEKGTVGKVEILSWSRLKGDDLEM